MVFQFIKIAQIFKTTFLDSVATTRIYTPKNRKYNPTTFQRVKFHNYLITCMTQMMTSSRRYQHMPTSS